MKKEVQAAVKYRVELLWGDGEWRAFDSVAGGPRSQAEQSLREWQEAVPGAAFRIGCVADDVDLEACLEDLRGEG